MAFLCPSGLGRSKQRRELQSSILERIYDGVEYDPMLQFEVGKTKSQNPEALRIVLHNFTACSREELTVRQGQKVHIIFKEGDWVYVVNSDKKEGFIPFTACAKIVTAPSKKIQKSSEETVEPNKTRQTDRVNNNTYNVKKSLIVHQEPSPNLDNSFYSEFTDDSFITSDWSNHTHKHHGMKDKHGPQSGERYDDNKNIIKSFFESTPYEKLPKFLEIFSSIPTSEIAGQRSSEELSPRDRNWSSDPNESSFISEGSTEYLEDTYITLFDFRGRHRDDVDIRQDEMITVVDKSDPFWYWIKKQDGSEGYVPSNYIGHSHDPKVATLIGKRRTKMDSTGTQDQMSPRSDDCCHGSPLSETSSVRSSNLYSETKQRPPKPPRTRKQTPRDSVKANRIQSSENRLSDPSSSQKRESRGKSVNVKHSSKLSAHHLSLENLSLKTSRHTENGTETVTAGATALKDRRNTSSRHRRPNYREYRSNSQRSYTFEESNDYFDAYFCDEPDPNFKKSSADKDNVINVSEILKSRNPPSAGLLKSSSHKNTWMKSGSNDHGHNILNLRQFMQTLPSTEISNDNNANHADKSDQNIKSNADKHSHGNQSRKVDWSFGYPRKIRSNQNSISSSSQAVHKQEGAKLRLSESSSAIQTKKHAIKQDNRVVENITREVKSVGSQTDLNDISVQVPDMDNPSDQMFLDLLSATDNLLEVSEKILTDRKAMKKPNVKVYDTGGDRRSSSSETNDDVDEKCSHFIMNQVIDTDIGQLTNRSEESVNVLSDFSEHGHIDSNSEITEHANEVSSSVADHNTDKFSNDSKSTHEDVETVIYANMRTSSSVVHKVSENSTSVINEIRNNSDKSSTSLNCEVFETSTKVSPTTSDSDCVFDNATNVHGVTEFVVQYDYEPDSDMALPILKNEILHISLDIQEDDHWYWAYSPRLRCYGYVPKQYVKIPLVTII